MDKHQIEELISKKVAEAKLEVAEKRLHFFMGMAGAALALFGVVFPLWQSNRTSDKVDNALVQMRQENTRASDVIRSDSRTSAESLERTIPAIKADLRAEIESQSRQIEHSISRGDSAIQDMNKQFKDLAGTQLRKPKLECRVKGASLEGHVVNITSKNKNLYFEIKNVGDATARILRYKLYTNIVKDCNRYILAGWEGGASDEPSYKCSYQTLSGITIDSQDTQIKEIEMIDIDFTMQGNHPAALKIFYEQPEPRKYNFSINIDTTK